jgi:hypothetical protein
LVRINILALRLLALVLFPFVWLISLPLRLLGITLEAVFALLRGLLFLPARLSKQVSVLLQPTLGRFIIWTDPSDFLPEMD